MAQTVLVKIIIPCIVSRLSVTLVFTTQGVELLRNIFAL